MQNRSGLGGEDRRTFKRAAASFILSFSVKAPSEVSAQYAGRELDAIAQDIGEGGIGLLTNGVIPVGARLSMKFKIFNEPEYMDDKSHRAFELEGDVRSSLITEETDYRLGVEFVSVSEDERRFLTNFV